MITSRPRDTTWNKAVAPQVFDLINASRHRNMDHGYSREVGVPELTCCQKSRRSASSFAKAPRGAAVNVVVSGCFDCYYHAARCRGLHERVGNLFCEPLLHLQPARAHVRHARKLREAEHSAVGQVADVAPAVKG